MSFDIIDIIILMVCILLSIILTIYLNRNRILLNCNICKYCNKRQENEWDTFRQELENNNIEDNIKLIKNMENNNKDEVELL